MLGKLYRVLLSFSLEGKKNWVKWAGAVFLCPKTCPVAPPPHRWLRTSKSLFSPNNFHGSWEKNMECWLLNTTYSLRVLAFQRDRDKYHIWCITKRAIRYGSYKIFKLRKNFFFRALEAQDSLHLVFIPWTSLKTTSFREPCKAVTYFRLRLKLLSTQYARTAPTQS